MSNQNPDYWKQRYQQTWSKASGREKAIIERIYKETGKVAEPVGLGAGSDAYLSGSAASQGYEKGGADLHVVDTNVYLEITGPQSKRVPLSDPLWIRPDKIRNAQSNFPQHETWLIHWLELDGTLRVIHFDQNFFHLANNGTFRIVNPTIRGTRETYVEVPARHPCVLPWTALVDRLNQI